MNDHSPQKLGCDQTPDPAVLVHELPTRLRFKLQLLRDLWIDGAAVAAYVETCDGVKDARINHHAQSSCG
jgi:hypothetical protein